jgi:hypothetical protein
MNSSTLASASVSTPVSSQTLLTYTGAADKLSGNTFGFALLSFALIFIWTNQIHDTVVDEYIKAYWRHIQSFNVTIWFQSGDLIQLDFEFDNIFS